MRHISSWFQAAAQPRKWSVVTIDCDALSIWHVYALAEAGNPYICGGKRTQDAAAELLIYCSGGIEHGRRVLASSRYAGNVTRRIYKRLHKQPFERVDAAIVDYVSAGIRTPGHKQKIVRQGDAPVRYMCTPKCWALVESMSNRLIFGTLDAAWDMPYSTALCLFDAMRDASGDDDTLETSEEEKRYDAMIASRNESEAV